LEFHHTSVLLNECINNLNIKEDGIYTDCTLGGAGHSKKICERLNEKGILIGIDQDIDAINSSYRELKDYKNKIFLEHQNFSNIRDILNDLNIKNINGALLDLGVSSYQLDEANRGFSYMNDAPLDMRMNREQNLSAYNVVNEYSKSELERIIIEYGEERWAKRIVEFILEARKNKTINTTYELVDIIKKAIPKGARKEGPHPAKRTFQAIRIEVNGELSILKKSIEDIVDVLEKGGRLCIITFHSLEDRIVKETFKFLENPCICPPDFPVCVCGNKSKAKIITKKPIIPSKEELENNHRARSAKLRVLEKI